MKIYLLSGLGGDERIFRGLRFPEGFTTHFIPWQTPQKEETLPDYLKRLAADIDTSEPFILCGVSFGGICIQEMCSFLSPEKLILISTITGPSEIPAHIKLGAQGNWQKFVSSQFYKWVADKSAPVVGIYEKESVEDFQEMMEQFDPLYYKWAVRKVGSWKGAKPDVPCLRLHGSRDKVFPVNNIKNADIIEGGEHIMVMLQPEVISEKIADFLKD